MTAAEAPVAGSGARRAAVALLVVTALALAWVIVLVAAFAQDVQMIDAPELIRRAGEARAYFTADYVFVVLYAVVAPVLLWRFGRVLPSRAEVRVPNWIAAAVVLLVGGGIADAVENGLLLAAAGSGSQSTVDLAHLVAWPKYGLLAAGFVIALVAAWRALRVVRER